MHGLVGGNKVRAIAMIAFFLAHARLSDFTEDLITCICKGMVQCLFTVEFNEFKKANSFPTALQLCDESLETSADTWMPR